MHFILDYRASKIAERLDIYGEITFFDAGSMVYPAISGHPDIFIANIHGQWILAPNAPSDIIDLFNEMQIPFESGIQKVGFRYPDTAFYNIFCDDEIAVVSKYTDESIMSQLKSKEIIEVKQGYIACNLARIGSEFITSDAGIEKELASREKVVRFVKPAQIKLSGASNGFIGGTIGQFENKVLYTGSRGSSYAAILSTMCASQNKELIFIGNEEPLDVGGIVVL
ncbi:MAG: hypothetical protein A2W93_00605 [Bacteroidetes bacterium GWF2_43_63]|nr:MAG: hypothetical protein A2W94_12915 [Bacteroidetes bacterium GWE2_42_42]OFY53899.1 MAG: hypothetical protein A2W93_00605 [Bacteroidetes bacterium GWF2_43_63]HBG69864.1 hypothetical protein [Bacteroidales bacterium]HCB60939.1 hypothetical protein [Bacteroidales bacterium]HCY24495.1 hypothetical protein [Bacteroidales bacterium]